MRFVRRLDGSGADGREVGGKAAALDQLIGWGFPVPPCVAVTAAAYCIALRDPHPANVAADLSGRPASDPAAAEADARRIEEAFLAVELPYGLDAELVRVGEELADGGRLAVRSSATSEDALVASFAGQYQSLLGVHPRDVPDAVRRVWASLWGPAARSYRQAQEVGDEDVAMAVVIQRMVEPDAAGVLFTADPRGRPADFRVELVEGLADELVSGHVTPRSIVVSRRGPRRIPGDVAGLVDRLLGLGTAVEERFGSPQDIEWAAAGEQVFLVQSRPITTLGAPDDDGFDTPVAPDTSYTTAGIAEMLPGVLPPLLWSLNGPMIDDAFRRLYDSLGASTPDEPVVVRVRARAALNLDLLRSLAAVTGGSAREIERQYFGEPLTEGDDDAADERGGGQAAGIRLLAASLRAARLRHALGREAATVQAAIDEVVDLQVPVDDLGPAPLMAYRDQIHDLAARATAAQAAVGVAAAASYRALELFLHRYLGDEATLWAQQLTAGAVAAAGGGAALGLDDVAASAGPEPRRAVLDGGGDGRNGEGDGRPADPLETVESRVAATPGGSVLAESVRAAARRAGSQSVFGGTTWDEAPHKVWQALRAQIVATSVSPGRSTEPAPDQRLAELERRLASGLRWRLTRLLTGQVVDVRRRILHRLVEDAVRFLGLREDMKLSVLRLGGESRRTTRRAAALLRGRGVLADDADVELLAEHELARALCGHGRPDRRLAGRRRGLARAEQRGDLPRLFVGRPAGVAQELPDVPDENYLQGWAASPGQHRGRPQVVHDPTSGRLGTGDVLVAHTTDPSWTSLFLEAGAIVVEEGGPLSHAAIVARELGVPAVVNVTAATARLAGVTSVTVDGDQGIVLIHDATDGEDEEAPA